VELVFIELRKHQIFLLSTLFINFLDVMRPLQLFQKEFELGTAQGSVSVDINFVKKDVELMFPEFSLDCSFGFFEHLPNNFAELFLIEVLKVGIITEVRQSSESYNLSEKLLKFFAIEIEILLSFILMIQ
jgi:hypothetical protein